MKKLTNSLKCALAIFIAVVITASVMSPVAIVAEEEGIPQPVLTTAAELMKSSEETPPDYKENGPAPTGAPLNEDIQATVCNEMISYGGKAHGLEPAPNYNIKVYDTVEDKVANHTVVDKNVSLDFVYSDAVAFDPNHTGRRDHAAMLVFKKENSAQFLMQLMIMDLTKMEVVCTKDYHRETKLGMIDFENQIEYFSIVPACVDGKHDDHFAITYQKSDIGNGNPNVIQILNYKDNNINVVKELNIADYIKNVAAYDYSRSCDNFINRPTFRITCGDYDRDGKDEMALTASAACAHTPYKHTLPDGTFGYAPTDFTTEVAVIDDITGSAKSVYNDYIYGLSGADNNNEYYNMLYGASCASGDVDGDNCPDIVVGGYWANMGVAKNRQNVSNAYAFNATNDFLGLTIIQFNGKGYIKSNTFTSKMNNVYTKSSEKKYDEYTYFLPVALETAYLQGRNIACTIFLNGDLYIYKIGYGTSKVYTYKLFTQDRIIHDTACVRKVTKGNFTNDEIGRECFGFDLYSYGRGGGFRNTTYEDFIAFVYPNYASGKSSEIGSYSDNSDEFNSAVVGFDTDYSWFWERPYQGISQCFGILCADSDRDGLRCRYVGTEYIYTDPQVMAVLQAAPYFKELGNWNTFMGNTSYTITTSYGSTTAGSKSWNVDAGVVVDGEAGFIVNVEAHLNAGYTHSNTDSWGTTYSSTNTSTFTACAEDTVLVRRIPLQIYAYQVWDNDTHDWRKNPDGSMYYSTTAMRLQPAFYQLKLDQYNDFVDSYNDAVKTDSSAIKLKNIQSKADQDLEKYTPVLPVNATGNPFNYSTTPPPGSTYISEHSYALDTGAGSTTSSRDEVTTTTEGHSWSNGLHINFAITFGGGFKFFGAGAKLQAGPYIDYNHSWEESKEDSKSNGYGGSGTVCNIDLTNYLPENRTVVSKYGFTWRFAAWKTCLSSDKKEIPVYGYVLNQVNYPGQSPTNVYAEVEKTGKNVVVTWDKPTDIAGSPTDRNCYRIYRMLENEGDLQEIGKVDANTYTFSEPYDNLSRGKIYVYYVGCDYGGFLTPYSAISFKGSRVIGGMSGFNEGLDSDNDQPDNPPATPTSVTTTTIPKTSDPSNVGIALGIMLVACAAGVVLKKKG